MPLFYTIPQSHCVVIERFGKFNRVQREGLRFKLPVIETIKRVDSWGDQVNQNGFQIEMMEQQTDTPTRQTHTRDNVAVHANASVYWRILDPRKALYEIDALPRSVCDIALNALRSNVGTMNLDEVLAERQSLNERIASELSETARKWGIQFTRVEIQELQTTEDTARAMRQQMDAERKRRAAIAEAEGMAQAEVKVAEANKEAAVLRAEGAARALELTAAAEANYLKRLCESLPPESAAKVLVAQKYLTGFDAISKNPADKVFLPNSFQGLFALPTESNAGQNPPEDAEPL
jgi:regulator of protease activity HflC (stomatin/prohibitin superfamily)